MKSPCDSVGRDVVHTMLYVAYVYLDTDEVETTLFGHNTS